MSQVHRYARDFEGALDVESVEGLKRVLAGVLGSPLTYPLEKREIVTINQRIHQETVRYSNSIVRDVKLDRRWLDTVHIRLYQPDKHEINITLIYDDD